MLKVILYYKYVPIEDPEALAAGQREICERLNLKGRIIIASEGINGTLEGKAGDINLYAENLKSDTRFSQIKFKQSKGDGNAFPKLSVKVRDEIVSAHLGSEDVKPYEVTGEYLSAGELKDWIERDESFYILDMRNGFEQEVGHFKGSVLPGMGNFRDLPKVLPKLLYLKDKKVVTVCTGGVRCEKASAYLLSKGFKNVYQLEDGIVSYMEKYPNEDFLGALYVFDKRIVMTFDKSSRGFAQREIVGKCAVCQARCEQYVNCKNPRCNRHFIACSDCLDGDGKVLCPQGCIE